MKKHFIAIEGPIGVGKSSLTHQLCETYNFYESNEIVDENPFLSDLYEDISKWGFQTEMFFLCNRYKQLQDLAHIEQGIISDYHIHKNKIFAQQTLTSSEFDKFNRIYDILTEDIMMPDTIIFLDADLDILKSRIQKRNRSFEHNIEDGYLLNLKAAYQDFYDTLKSEGVNVIQINTSDLDFVGNPEDYDYILKLIKPLIGGTPNESI